MGQGGHITLVNGTRYRWQKTHQHQHQMDAWDFPETIQAGNSVVVYLQWAWGLFKNNRADAAETVYALVETDLTFQVQARATDGYDVQIVFTNLATPGKPSGSVINLGWKHNGYVNFILSGEVGAFTSSSPPTSWMQNNLSSLSGRTLRQLCIPGSHDSGMSVRSSGTLFGIKCNTITQTTGVLGQLQAGVRYFDIRPVISAGQYLTGHYGHIIKNTTWQGANGQSIASIIDDVNIYTATNKELVILHLSHDLNTDLGNNAYKPFTPAEWNALLLQLQGINNLFVAQDATTVDLTRLTLDTFIGGNRAAVIVIVPTDISLGKYANQGFYSADKFPVFDEYSDTNDLGRMIDNQLRKMKTQRSNPSASYFLLSWTLTQSAAQASTCSLPLVGSSILDLADTANAQLYSRLLPACTGQCYPNVLYIDNIQTSDTAALAMAVNSKAIFGERSLAR